MAPEISSYAFRALMIGPGSFFGLFLMVDNPQQPKNEKSFYIFNNLFNPAYDLESPAEPTGTDYS